MAGGGSEYSTRSGFLNIIDVSNPTKLRDVGKIDINRACQGFYVQGKYAYVVGFKYDDFFHREDGFLRVIDVSNPTNPSQVGNYDIPKMIRWDESNGAYGIYVAGNYAYVTDEHQFHVIDVSAPTNPRLRGKCSVFWAAAERAGIQVIRDYAFVVGGIGYTTFTDSLFVIDISLPEIPQVIGTSTPGGYEVSVVGGYVYMASGAEGLRVVDVSVPMSPKKVGLYDTPNYDTRGVYVVEDYAYVVDQNLGLRTIDISNSQQPQQINVFQLQFEKSAKYEKIYVAGPYVYLIGGAFCVIDISNPTKPKKVGTYNPPNGIRGGCIKENYAYITNWDSLLIIDISNPTNLHEVGRCDPPAVIQDSSSRIAANEVYVAGGYAYITSCGNIFSSDFLWAVNISDSTHPTVVGVCNIPFTPGNIFIAGNYVYLAESSASSRGDFLIIDVSDPSKPRKMGVCDTTGNSIYVAGKYAYVPADGIPTWERLGLEIIDISDPTKPHQAVFYDTLEQVYAVYAVNDFLYLATGKGGLYILKQIETPPPDTHPPILLVMPSVSEITSSSAVIKWNTDEKSSSTVEYGLRPEYSLVGKGADNVTEHSVLLSSLSPNTTYYYRVGSTDVSGNNVWSEQKTFKTPAESEKTVEPKDKLIVSWSEVRQYKFALGQNYPNPFNPETWIPFQLAKGSEVKISIYDSLGRLIRILDLGSKEAGSYTSQENATLWDGRNQYGEKASSGVYFYTIEAGKYIATRKMVLLN